MYNLFYDSFYAYFCQGKMRFFTFTFFYVPHKILRFFLRKIILRFLRLHLRLRLSNILRFSFYVFIKKSKTF